MRRLLIAGNWKMHSAPDGAFEKKSPYQTHSAIDVVVFPSFLDIKASIDAGLITGAQYGVADGEGAHTGDVCMSMLKELGCHYVLCGHSERRHDHHETNEDVAAQVVSALEHNLHPVVCIGETKEQRDSNKQQSVIEKQLQLLPLESDITIAYEPIWAIGTGDTATPEQAQAMHQFIRSLLPEDRKESTRILYGGSMKPENAEELLKLDDVDGGLVGSASLKPDQFSAIVQTALSLQE